MKKGKRKSKRMSFPAWVILRIMQLKWSSWATYCAILCIVGCAINIATNFSFKHFLLHQIFLITATTMLVYAIKSFFIDIQLFDKSSPSSLLNKNPEVYGVYKEKLLPLQRSGWSFLISVIITTFFFTCIALLNYIQLDIIGIYAIYIAGTSVLIGVYVYLQYLYFLWFIHELGKCKNLKMPANNLYVPADTKWVSQIAKTSQRMRTFFLLIGLIYVIEYSILIPENGITMDETKILLNMSNNSAFIISWIALFILVIIAFPIINYIQYKLVTNLVDKLKAQTVDDLTMLMFEELQHSNDKNKFVNTIAYNMLIDNVKKSKNYPIKRKLSYETIMTLITFAVHMFNLFSKISDLGQLIGVTSQS